MNGRWKIGELSGIGIFIHWSFLILPAWIAFSAISGGAGLMGAGFAVASVLAIFGCVVLHEMGHALAARRYGVPTRDITLYPIGGVASLARIPREPMHEFVIAIAGPAVNVAIAAVLLALMLLGGGFSAVSVNPFANSFVMNLFIANVILVIFNMLPAFPMDGGRVLRSLLAMRLPYLRATQIAAQVGKGMAIVFGLFALVSFHWMLLFVALFVYFAADQERRAVEQREWMGAGGDVQPEIVFHPSPRSTPEGTQRTRYRISDSGRLVVILDPPSHGSI